MRDYQFELRKEMIEKYKEEILDKQNDSLEHLAATMKNCDAKKRIDEYNSQLETNNKVLISLKKGYDELITQTKGETEKSNKKDNMDDNTRIECGSFDKAAASNIKKLNDKIKKLKALYTIIKALKQQAGLLDANKYIFGTLNSKLLEATKNGEELKGKSVSELLFGADAIIKTNYISKDDLQKIKDQQTDEDKENHGAVNTVLRYDDKFLKEGEIFKSFGAQEKRVLQLAGMGYYKPNCEVLIDEANHNNIVNEIAVFLGFDVIIGSDIVVSDGNIDILMMDDASKNPPRSSGKISPTQELTNKLKNDKDILQMLWDSASALAFLDIVMNQLDRNPGNYFYGYTICGIDNDYFAPVSDFYKKLYQRNFGKINEIRQQTENIEYDESNIVEKKKKKMPVISETLKKKILNIDRNQFELQLNSLFMNDVNRKDKVQGIINRFNKLRDLIENGTIEVCKEINNDIISKIEAHNAIVAKLPVVTGEHYCSKKT